MGIRYFSHVFIGRHCTDEEIKTSLEKIKDLNGDWDLFDPEDPLECLESEDGYPIFAFSYGAGFQQQPFENHEDYEWFVVAKYIKNVSNDNHDFISVNDIQGVKFDDRYKIIVLNDIS